MHQHNGLFDLKHPNIVRIFGICHKDGQIILEYYEKRMQRVIIIILDNKHLQFGNFILRDLTITAVIDVADGLHYLHERELVHGDIKPLNVLVCGEQDEEYTFKIMDYACVGNKVNTQISSKSVSLKQLMTPAYMAPELFGIDKCHV